MSQISLFKINKETFLKSLPVILASLIFTGGIIYAWTNPSVAPPGGNAATPINVGSDDQAKTGSLTIKGSLTLNESGKTEGLTMAKGLIKTAADGIKFSDNTIQTTAWTSASGGGETLKQGLCYTTYINNPCAPGFYSLGAVGFYEQNGVTTKCCDSQTGSGPASGCPRPNTGDVYLVGGTYQTIGECVEPDGVCPHTYNCYDFIQSYTSTQTSTTYTCQSDGTWTSSASSISCTAWTWCPGSTASKCD